MNIRPEVSVIVPVYNEEARLPDALKQALAVDYPCEIELVVVDDGSKDEERGQELEQPGFNMHEVPTCSPERVK